MNSVLNPVEKVTAISISSSIFEKLGLWISIKVPHRASFLYVSEHWKIKPFINQAIPISVPD
jgi:hypothetical protein